MNSEPRVPAILELPPGLLEAAHMTPSELKLELALTLFRQDKLSFGKARELAGLSVIDFQRELGRRNIPVHYDVIEFEQDVATMKAMGHL